MFKVPEPSGVPTWMEPSWDTHCVEFCPQTVLEMTTWTLHNFWRWFWFCDSLKSEEIHMNSCFLSAAVCCSSWGYLPSPSEFDKIPSLKRLENFYTEFNADSEYFGWLRVSTLTWWEILGRVAGPAGWPKQDPSWPPSIPIKIGRQPVEGMTTWTVHNFLRWFRMCKPLESEEIHLIQCSKSVH